MSAARKFITKVLLFISVTGSVFATFRLKSRQLGLLTNSTSVWSWKNVNTSNINAATDSINVSIGLRVPSHPKKLKADTTLKNATSNTTPAATTSTTTANAITVGEHGRVLDLPPDFNICRLKKTPIIGDICTEYLCAGQPYDDFMQLHQFPLVLQKYASHNKEQPLMWGKRPSIFPPSHKNSKNRTVLLLGNSHTRQFFNAVQCQYSHQFVGSETMVPGTVTSINVIQYTFRQDNGAYLNFHGIMNHPTIYSDRWKENVESLTGTSFPQYDAIVLGHHNAFDPRYAKKAKLWIRARSYSEQHPAEMINFTHHSKGPTVAEIAEHYKNGPIIYVSMFASYKQAMYKLAVKQIEKLKTSGSKNRDVLRAINARRYTNEMGGEECTSDSLGRVDTCAGRDNPRYSEGHRCMGDKGGQPDLLVWDFVEVIWELFSSELIMTQSDE